MIYVFIFENLPAKELFSYLPILETERHKKIDLYTKKDQPVKAGRNLKMVRSRGLEPRTQ